MKTPCLLESGWLSRVPRRCPLLIVIITSLTAIAALGQGTAFTYQGRLNDGLNPASGPYEMHFTLHDAATNGNQVGPALSLAPVPVTNGLFTASLDFGNSPFTGAARWLEITVNVYGSDRPAVTLTPRQPITPTPYAIRAANFTGPIAEAQLPPNIARLDAPQTFTGPVRFANPSNNFSGTFSGNGAGVTNVNLATINSGGVITANPRTVNSNTFSLSASPPVAANLVAVVAADLNGDGRADLVTANHYSGTFSILLNDGSGGFVRRNVPIPGTCPTDVAIARLNSDEYLDLVVLDNCHLGMVSVFTNNSLGEFTLASSISAGSRLETIVAADLNGDGYIDLVAADVAADALSLLFNDGTGGLRLTRLAHPLGDGYAIRTVAAADVNGDARADLITGDASEVQWLAGRVSIFVNDGAGGFTRTSSVSVDGYPDGVAVSDINGDGHIDVMKYAGPYGDTLSVLTNDSRGAFKLSDSVRVSRGANSVITADVNGDGRPDLITANPEDDSVSIVTNAGNGRFALAYSPHVGNGPRDVAVADLNGDQLPDLISANYLDGTLSVLLQNPTFNFRGDSFVGTSFNGGAFWGAFTGDGRSISNVNLAAINSSGAITVGHDGSFVLAGTYSASQWPYDIPAPDFSPSSPLDLNGDGFSDRIALYPDPPDIPYRQRLVISTNNGSGNFLVVYSDLVSVYVRAVVGADVDNDGDTDLILLHDGADWIGIDIAGRSPGKISVLTNDGTARFILATETSIGNYPLSLLAADVNRDGRVDLVVGNDIDYSLWILTNSGQGSFTFSSSPAVGNRPNSLGASDIDRDGSLDLISTDGSTLSVLLNLSFSFRGNFAGDGSELTKLAAGNLTGTVAEAALTNAWRIGALHMESVSRPLASDFCGPSIESSVNVINGSGGNFAGPGLLGATVSGGGWSWSGVEIYFSEFSPPECGGRVTIYRPNSVLADFGTVCGGLENTSSGYAATVSGGGVNISSNAYATVPGGNLNIAGGAYAFAAGQRAKALHSGTFVWSDSTYADFASTSSNQFLIRADGGVGINTNDPGGAALNVAGTIRATSFESAGGPLELRTAGQTALRLEQVIKTSGFHTFFEEAIAINCIGGSGANSVTAGVMGATIGGGGVVGGSEIGPFGYPNHIGNDFGTVSGGLGNSSDGYAATVSGGVENASSGYAGTVGGGAANTSNNDYATVPGGFLNIAGGQYSFAAGQRAQALHDGAFVWGDSTGADIVSTADNQFTVRATGGVRFLLTSNATGAELAPGSGAWSTLSDRNAKTNFSSANAQEILKKVAALPLATWNYKAQDKSIRHIGPTAQDFHAAFGIGENDLTISTVDADGVALAAIQGLNQKLEQREAEIHELRNRVLDLERLLQSLTSTQDKLRGARAETLTRSK